MDWKPGSSPGCWLRSLEEFEIGRRCEGVVVVVAAEGRDFAAHFCTCRAVRWAWTGRNRQLNAFIVIEPQ